TVLDQFFDPRTNLHNVGPGEWGNSPHSQLPYEGLHSIVARAAESFQFELLTTFVDALLQPAAQPAGANPEGIVTDSKFFGQRPVVFNLSASFVLVVSDQQIPILVRKIF